MTLNNWHCGLDIGSTSVRAVLARSPEGEPKDSARLEVLAVGQADAEGVHKGEVVQPEVATASVRRAIEELEQAAGTEIGEAWVSVSTRNRRSINSSGEIQVPSGLITRRDVKRAVRSAVPQPGQRAWLRPPFEILHALPQEFWVDDLDPTQDPTDWNGHRVQSFVHLVSCPRESLRRIEKAVNLAGVQVRGMLISTFATAAGVFGPDDDEDEFLLIDIGAENTGLALYRNGAVWWSGVMPTGGRQYSRDVALGFQAPIASAEDAKRQFGHALFGAIPEGDTLELSVAGARQPVVVGRRRLAQVLQARAEQDMTILRDRLQKWLEHMPPRIVLSGGGANLGALDEVVRLVFGAAVERRGPRNLTGLVDRVAHPEFAGAFGLCRHAAKQPRPARASGGVVPRLARAVGHEFRRLTRWRKRA